MASAFRGVIEFFGRLGIYDVILPFLFVFTIVFAALEKTKVFGLEEFPDGKKYTKKNLNSMVAFVTAFLVIASSRLVAIINQTVAQVAVVLIIMFCILLVIGFFAFSSDKEVILEGTTGTLFIIGTMITIFAIFFNAVGWLDPLLKYVANNFTGNVVGSIVLVAFVIGMMFFITSGGPKKAAEAEK